MGADDSQQPSFGDYSSLSGGGGGGMNPADIANSGIHGPSAAAVRRFNPDQASRYRDAFHCERTERCLLCNEKITSWAGHVVFVSHQARLTILDRLLSGQCGPPELAVSRWWNLLNLEDPDGAVKAQHSLTRIPSLSSWRSSNERRSRLQYVLRFLQGNGVLKVALGVFNDATREFGRSNVFERFEMVGDNVVKAVFFDRLQQIFPVADGGAGGKMSMLQQLIDSNEGLMQAYDYLDLDSIIGNSLSQSKFKADVMEALFGELQSYLWAAVQLWESSPVEYSPLNPAAGPELRYIVAVVRHTLLELTDVMLMFAVESVVLRSKKPLAQDYKGSAVPRPLPHPRTLQMPRTTADASAALQQSSSRRGSAKAAAAAVVLAPEEFFVAIINSSTAAAAAAAALAADDGGSGSQATNTVVSAAYLAALRNEVKPFLAVAPHSRANAVSVETTLLTSAGNEAAARNLSAGTPSAQSSASSASRGGSSSSSFVSDFKPLSQRLAEEKAARLKTEASWHIRPVPCFVATSRGADVLLSRGSSSNNPSSLAAADREDELLDEEELEYALLQHIAFTERCIDAAAMHGDDDAAASSDEVEEHGEEHVVAAAKKQKAVNLSHVDAFCAAASSSWRAELFAAPSLSAERKSAPAARSPANDALSLLWWDVQSTSCPWSPLEPRLAQAPLPQPQPPLEPAMMCSWVHTRSSSEDNAVVDEENALLMRRMVEETTVALHRMCADDISRELTREPDPLDVHDFDFSQLRPAGGKLVWN